MVVEKLEEASNFLKDKSFLEFILILITDIIYIMKDSLNVVVAGATGYIGLELVKILSKHPKAKILYLCATQSIGKSIYKFDKKLIRKKLPKISSIKNVNWNNINVIFTALPNGEAQKIAKKLPENVKLIDLSADFRLDDVKAYKKWYGINHKCKKLNNRSIYSIAEFSKKDLNKYKIISCPGCYPTSVQIPLIPLIRNNVINLNKIIVDSKSGYSGAGKNIKKKFKFKNLFSSVSAYGVGSHRHMVEIEQQLSKECSKKVNISFTPHLIPTFRGILSTIYLEINKNYNAKQVYNLLKNYHKNNFFVKIAKFNKPIGTGKVMNTNFCEISVCKERNKNKIIILCAIDNLIKGGSGQAVQNMNLAFKFKENLGLV
jgi:N-acetyl-gamma-glutamyl-phosphate reductase